MVSDPPQGDVLPAPEVGEAYVAGMVARHNWRSGDRVDSNPYHHATQPWLAWRSGWNDQGVWMARNPVREQYW